MSTVFDKFSSWVKEQSASLKSEVQKFKNKDFLDAVVAGCAMVAYADGVISPDEKRKTIGFIQQNEALSVFNVEEAIKIFESYVTKMNFDLMIGKGEALKSIAKLKKKPEEAKLMVRVCCAIGAADGNFDDTEKQIVRDICTELGLNPKDFNLV
ncbi:MAG: tellurite resistance TerB family protein [Desulfobacterales bacterium]|nr:tellurite resistance TerB family protein [Desulfobacterales bacterium]